MSDASSGRRLLMDLCGLWLVVAAPAVTVAQVEQSGTVEISQAQVGAVLGQTVGGGTLRFAGRSYPFNLAGLGAIGGGAPGVTAVGDVYDLDDLSDFSGTYRERAGTVSASADLDRTITLVNEHGVSLRLRSRRADARLRLGPDGARIRLNVK